MKITKFLVPLFLCLIPAVVFGGTTHYVDCSAPSDGTGSYANPWNNIDSVNKHSFSSGDDLYFKEDVTCTVAGSGDGGELWIDWTGTSADRVIIGCYDGNGDFTCDSGTGRAIIDGNNQAVPAQAGYRGLVMVQESTCSGSCTDYYVTIQDLKVQYSGYHGIKVNKVDHVNVDNCEVYRPFETGIVYTYGQTGLVTNNDVHDVQYPFTGRSDGCKGGAGIEIGLGADSITIRGNKVYQGCNEGIGVYTNANNIIVENNVVYDFRNVALYVSNADYNIFRYNLVYNSDDTSHPVPANWGGMPGIYVGCEEDVEYNKGSYNKIYGNLVAGCQDGIRFYHEVSDPPNKKVVCSNINNNKIYNNTFVDNDQNFAFDLTWSSITRSGNEIKNNISLTTGVGMKHSTNYSPEGVTWSHNLYDEDPCVFCDADNDAVIGSPDLEKSTGWRSLPPGTVNGTEFSPKKGSGAIGRGVFIAGYNDRINYADFTADPIKVSIVTDNTPDIGAWLGTGDGKSFFPAPGALKFGPQ